MDVRREQRALAEGAHIVVGTPGRLRDHLERGHLDTSAMRAVVLDEADEMLDLGFREDLTFILDATPAERRTLLFSATIAREIATLAQRNQRNAVRIDTIVQTSLTAISNIVRFAAPQRRRERRGQCAALLRLPARLVFCATRDAVRRLHATCPSEAFPQWRCRAS